MSGAVEAVYIYDLNSLPILRHVYRGRPLSSSDTIRLYKEQPSPQPSVIYLPNCNPSTLLFSVNHADLLFIASTSQEIEPLLVLEFLHRFIDALEEYLVAPLFAGKIETNYDVVAQLLGEMCDAGVVSNTEPNALRDAVEMPGWMGKLFGNVNLPGAITGSGSSTPFTQTPSLNPQTSGPYLPWRRSNVRHTSNEMYVDIIEELSVIVAPSGRPLSAFANGTIAFTSKLSGVPELSLHISAPGGKAGIEKAMDLPIFHPCVRLARWKERPGELSFVPPDGKFVLAGYEVDLLPSPGGIGSIQNLHLPVSIEVSKSLGASGADFEVRVSFSSRSLGTSTPPSAVSNAARMGFGSRTGTSSPAFGGSSSAPLLESVVATVPLPSGVHNLGDIKASRGEASYSPGESSLQWRIPTKEPGSNKPIRSATLKCTVMGESSDDTDEHALELSGYVEDTYQSKPVNVHSRVTEIQDSVERDERRVQQNALLMPSSAMVSFSVKGWLASGIKVDSINLNMRQSKGLSDAVKPYKGVKYLTVSQNGVEIRC